MDDIRDNQVLPLINSDAMVSKMMRDSPINPCHITKNIIFLMTGFDQDQMNMVKGTFTCDICTEGRGGQKSQILRMNNSDRLREMQTEVRGPIFLFIVSLIQTLLPRILYHTPAGTSPMTMLHFAQIYSGGFRGFDGGVGYNLRAYGTPYPRRYGLDNARYPVAIYWGPNDWLATPRDVRWLAERLPNVVLNK